MLNPSLYSNNDVGPQNSTLATTKRKTTTLSHGESRKDKQWCDHCNKLYHTREIFQKIHVKLTNQKSQSQRRSTQFAYMDDLETEKSTNLTLFVDQLELLHQLPNQMKLSKMSNLTDTPKPSASLAKQDTTKQSLFSYKLATHSWIVDIGALDHMISLVDALSTYEACDRDITISMVDGVVSSAIGEGLVYLAKLALKFVLHMPKLKYNLLSE